MTRSLVDAEKTYSGLTAGCAAAGKAGCNLIQFLGDGATGDDVKALLNYAHDVIDSISRLGDLRLTLFLLLAGPCTLSRWGRCPPCSWPHEGYGFRLSSPWSLVADFATVYLFNLLYHPTEWSEAINGDVYQTLLLLAQLAQSHNVTVGGSTRYTVPSVLPPTGKTFLSGNGAAPSPNLTSYALAAISGADNFNDDSVTIKDIFDTIVGVTREVTSACESPIFRPCLFNLPTHLESSRKHVDSWVRTRGCIFSG